MLHLNCEQNSVLWHLLKMFPQRLSATQVSPALRLGGSTKCLIEAKRGKRNWKPAQLNVPAVQHGVKYESLSVEKARFVLDPDSDAYWIKPGIVMDPCGDPVCASPDAMFCKNGILSGLEVKTPYSKPLPLRVEDLSIEHLVQCFVSVSVTRVREWYLFYYSVSENRGVLYRISADPELWQKEFLPRIRGFLKFLRGSGFPKRANNIERQSIDFLKKKLRSRTQRLPLSRSLPVRHGEAPESCASRDGR